MKKSSMLLVTVGLLIGFVAGYLAQDLRSAHQPPRALPGGAAGPGATAQAGPAGAANPGANPGPGADPQAQMQAVQQLRAYVDANPDDAEAVLRLANLNFDIQQWQGAARLYEQYLELEPESPDVLSDLGISYRGMGQFDRAIEIFDRAQEIEPDHWQSRFNEAIVLAFDLGDLERADVVVEELERLQPGNPQVDELSQAIDRRRGAT